MIERLQAKRLIERKPSGEDKRIKLLYLTKAGAVLLRDIMASVDRAQARMLQPLKPADRKTLVALLTQLVDLNNEASRVPLRAEDALALDHARPAKPDARVRIAVLVLPHIANFDDLDPLDAEPSVELVRVRPGAALPGDAALVILPGSKATIADLGVLR